jgi:chromosome partitioning protein
MAGLVITIAQRKGGAGKTTLATQLAVAWARCGARVAALDIDPQGSFSAWVELRRARLGVKAIGFDFAALPGWRAAQCADAGINENTSLVVFAMTRQKRKVPAKIGPLIWTSKPKLPLLDV